MIHRSKSAAAKNVLFLLLATALAAAAPFPVQAKPPGQGKPFTEEGKPKPGPKQDRVHFWLTILHNNDGESKILPTNRDGAVFGGMARYGTLVRQLKAEALEGGKKRDVVLLSSGDNFLAGPEFAVSLNNGVPFYDSIGLDLLDYDAFAIGNHEFDFGPDTLADFIDGFTGPAPFLSANLFFDNEPRLQALEDAERIGSSLILKKKGEKIGIIGATTPMLPFISSPRNVEVDAAVAEVVQAEVDLLTARGVDIIILISHLQSIAEDRALAPLLRGIDIVIAGGGDDLLANPTNVLVPGDVAVGPYPTTVTDADGRSVPIVTTAGNYLYVGRLVAGFNKAGELVEIDSEKSGPVRVAGEGNADAVLPAADIQQQVVEPVTAGISALAANVIATSEVALDGVRNNVRTRETNLGNLVADAYLSQARALAPAFSVPLPNVAITNAGGIRNDSIIPPGPITELTTFSILPFSNFLAVVPSVPAAQLKEILENAVSRVAQVDGRFGQIAGFRFVYDAAGVAQTLDSEGNVVTPGTRVREVVLDDGTVLVSGGAVLAGAPAVNVATIDFLAKGGDQYPFRGAPFTTLGLTYQRTLRNFIEGGLITAGEYPVGGKGRILRQN